MQFNLHNKRFRALSNTENGEVTGDTVFHYSQDEEIIWAEYAGGEIVKGFLVGVIGDGKLRFNYQHVNREGTTMTGKCTSTPEILPDGRLRLHEQWQWTTGDMSSGRSILEEIV